MHLWKLHKIPLLFSILSIIFYWSFAYDLVRTDSVKLLMLYGGLFFLFYKLIQFTKHNLIMLTWIAFAFRAIFILAIPNLSQDFYRFIWDGRLILEGLNPYLFTPISYISSGELPIAQAQELYHGMGSLNGSHFSNYPPLNQACFALANLFAGHGILSSVIGLRLIIILADFGTLYFGKKLLERLNIPVYHIFWYILNPLIIIELTGNLHFEGVMIFFLVWSLYLLHSGQWKLSAVILAFSVSIKLIPLIFLPLFFQKLGWKKSLIYYGIVGLITILLFSPFLNSEFINNYMATIGLWFQNFEFNASVYYIAREIGYLFRGWNEIAIIGKILPVVVILYVMYWTLIKRIMSFQRLMISMLMVIAFYYFMSTTVHPWYIATLVILGVIANYRFPLVWSAVVVLSYVTYANGNNQENLWIIGLEYLIVYGVFFYEQRKAFIKEAI